MNNYLLISRNLMNFSFKVIGICLKLRCLCEFVHCLCKTTNGYLKSFECRFFVDLLPKWSGGSLLTQCSWKLIRVMLLKPYRNVCDLSDTNITWYLHFSYFKDTISCIFSFYFLNSPHIDKTHMKKWISNFPDYASNYSHFYFAL